MAPPNPNLIDIENQLKAQDPNFGQLLNFSTYNLPNLVSVGVKFAFLLAALGAFFFLIMGALQWITAGGDKEGVEKARKKITGALIGLIILFLIYALAALLQTIFGIDILGNLSIPSLIP